MVTVKAITLAFSSISKICTKIGITKSPQSPDIVQNSDGGISRFLVKTKIVVTPEPAMILT